jgi:hypothetical protein
MPTAMSFGEVVALFPDAVWLEPAFKEPPTVKRVSDEQYAALAATITGADKAGKREISVNTAIRAPSPVPRAQLDGSHLMVKVMQEFKLRLAQFHVLPDGEKKKEFKVGLEAIGNFLVSCDPEIISVLEEVREEVTKPRFSLD